MCDHLFFDDCLNYLNFNSVSDEICILNNVKAIKIMKIYFKGILYKIHDYMFYISYKNVFISKSNIEIFQIFLFELQP